MGAPLFEQQVLMAARARRTVGAVVRLGQDEFAMEEETIQDVLAALVIAGLVRVEFGALRETETTAGRLAELERALVSGAAWTVFVAVDDGFAEAWAPVAARYERDGVFLLDSTPTEARLVFAPGMRVRCEAAVLNEGVCLVAKSRA